MKMKMPKLLRRKKLRATVARRSLRASAESYDDFSEPNMKLSRALLIVLVLHVVAVSGIIAFNAIKTRQDSYVKTAAKVAPASDPPAESTSDAPATKQNSHPASSTALSGQVPERSAHPSKSTALSSQSSKRDEEKTAKGSGRKHIESQAADSGKVYVVVKGDNPVAIAKKLKVSYDDLIALNHIDDPRKLQIGQKLLIPRAAKGKKADE